MSARFAAGDRVRVRWADPPGHLRTPYYIRGKAGVIERVLAPYPNPEERAYGRSGLPAPWLYRVRFRQVDLWREYALSLPRASGFTPEDTVDVELYEHWLEPA
jgi:nitrile hydratase